jgi:H+-transporting ATPase
MCLPLCEAPGTLIAVFELLNLMTPLGWKWALFVWGSALAWFLIEDRVKLLAYLDTEQPSLLRRDGTPAR